MIREKSTFRRINNMAGKVMIFTLAALLIFTFSCQLFKGQTEEEAPAEEVETVTGESGEELIEDTVTILEISIWESLGPKERLALMESIEDFLAEYPLINMEARHFRNQEELMDQFEAASLAGSGPEIILVDFNGVYRLAPENVVKEITDEVDYYNMLDGLVEISEYNGRKYIIPFRANDPLMFFYNKSLMEDVPNDFEEVIEYCKEKNNFEEQIYGFLLNVNEPDWVIPFIGGYSDWIVDYNTDSITLDTEAAKKTLDFLYYIYNEEKVLPFGLGYEDINALFKKGNAHMIINGLWAIDEYKEDGIDFGISKIPEVWGGYKYPTPLISGLGFMINTNCYGNKLEAAKNFVDYMLLEGVQAAWTFDTQTLPILKSIDENKSIENDDFIFNALQQAKICRGEPNEEIIRVIRDALRINLENVINGNITSEEAVLKIQEDAIKLRAGSITVEELKEKELED
jgi:arabinogalactan oligomer/maltooligosaccharide transport system substrate-binding protein